MAGTDRASFQSEAAIDRSAQGDAGGWRPRRRTGGVLRAVGRNRRDLRLGNVPSRDNAMVHPSRQRLLEQRKRAHHRRRRQAHPRQSIPPQQRAIIVIPKLVYAANYWLTSGSNVGFIVYSLALGAACTALLLWLALPLFRDTPIRMMLCAVLFPLAMFSAKLSHSYFLGMSGTIWLTADLFVILSAAALARAVAEQSASWLLAALLAGLLGVLSYSTAVYSLLTLLIACSALLLLPRLRGAMSWKVPAAMACGVLVLVLVLGAVYRNLPPDYPAWQFDPIEVPRFAGNRSTTARRASRARRSLLPRHLLRTPTSLPGLSRRVRRPAPPCGDTRGNQYKPSFQLGPSIRAATVRLRAINCGGSARR